MAKIDVLLKMVLDYNASDLHICVGEPPLLRINGELQRTKYHDLVPEEVEVLLLEMLDEKTLSLLKSKKDIDFAYELTGAARFRGNIFMERKGYGGAFRVIPTTIRTLRELGIPDAVYAMARLKRDWCS